MRVGQGDRTSISVTFSRIWQIGVAVDASQPDRDLAAAWREGDSRAAAVLFDRYVVRLTSLARARLSQRLARRIDPEDIVLSAYRSFFVAAADGRVSCDEEADLWPLLALITLRKVARQGSRHQAGRRSVDREVPLDSVLIEAAAVDATAEQAVALEEELTGLMQALPEREREILARTLQGEDQAAIAVALGCSERTVRRAIAGIREAVVERGELGGLNAFRPITRQADTGADLHHSGHETESAAEPQPTIELDDFDLKEMVGAGGFAKLYRCVRRSDGHETAVKFLRKKFWHDENAVRLMLNEMHFLQRVHHPNIVPLLGWGRSRDAAPFLVLEWIEGQNLSKWRDDEARTIDEVIGVVRPVLEGVSAAHDAGVLHCDLKPENVLIRDDGCVFLSDFGFARTIRPESPHIPRGGTAGYLAPEQVSSTFGEPDVRTDVYGIGGLIYALLTGRPPFVGESVPEILAEVVSGRLPAPMTRARCDVPAWLAAIVSRCLAKEPADRLPSVASVLREIDLHFGRGD